MTDFYEKAVLCLVFQNEIGKEILTTFIIFGCCCFQMRYYCQSFLVLSSEFADPTRAINKYLRYLVVM